MNKGVSVIVCCYNSAKRIEKTLLHLVRQKFSHPWEIIIVDNNCTDNTIKIIFNLIEKEDINKNLIKIIQEKEAGLSYARRTGVIAAIYDYIVFCDDDNWLSTNYLHKAFDILAKNETIGAVGGLGIAVSDTGFPNWFSSYQQAYAVGVQNLDSGFLSKNKYLWGAGIAIRKSILNYIYNSNINPVLSGRKGKKLLAGDDTEMCIWITWMNYKLYYDEDLIYKHYIPIDRINKEYLAGLLDGFRNSSDTFIKYRLVQDHYSSKNRFIRFFRFLKNYFTFFKKNRAIILEIHNIAPKKVVFSKETRRIINLYNTIKNNAS